MVKSELARDIRGSHRTWDCPYKKSELFCSYLLYSLKQGHTIGAFHDFIQRCNLDICHSFIEGRVPYGFGPDAVKALKCIFEYHKYLLTIQEHEAIINYEEQRKRGAKGGRKEEGGKGDSVLETLEG